MTLKGSSEMAKFDNEINILRKLEHPHLIKYFDSFLYKDNKYCIVMEYADGGDLYKKITEYKKEGKLIEEDKIWYWFLQTCSGLNYLHNNRIIHRDIKSQNVFLSKKGEVKLGDFGISKILKTEFTETSIGTPYFLSPEICQGEKYNHKSDLWMMGCLLYELATLERPFVGSNLPSLMLNIIKGDIKNINSSYSSHLQNLINQLLSKDPLKRPDIKDFIKDPFIARKVKEFNIDFSEESLKLREEISIPSKSNETPKIRLNSIENSKNNNEKDEINGEGSSSSSRSSQKQQHTHESRESSSHSQENFNTKLFNMPNEKLPGNIIKPISSSKSINTNCLSLNNHSNLSNKKSNSSHSLSCNNMENCLAGKCNQKKSQLSKLTLSPSYNPKNYPFNPDEIKLPSQMDIFPSPKENKQNLLSVRFSPLPQENKNNSSSKRSGIMPRHKYSLSGSNQEVEQNGSELHKKNSSHTNVQNFSEKNRKKTMAEKVLVFEEVEEEFKKSP